MTEREELEALRRRIAALETKLSSLARILSRGGFSSMTIDGLARTLSDAARELGK